jgi:hypothetical protein
MDMNLYLLSINNSLDLVDLGAELPAELAVACNRLRRDLRGQRG